MKRIYAILMSLFILIISIPFISIETKAAESDDLLVKDLVGQLSASQFYTDLDYQIGVDGAIDNGADEGLLRNVNSHFFVTSLDDSQFLIDFCDSVNHPDDNLHFGAAYNNWKLNIGRTYIENMYPAFDTILDNIDQYKTKIVLTVYSSMNVSFRVYYYPVTMNEDGDYSFNSQDGGSWYTKNAINYNVGYVEFTLTYNTNNGTLAFNNFSSNLYTSSGTIQTNPTVSNIQYSILYTDFPVYFLYSDQGYSYSDTYSYNPSSVTSSARIVSAFNSYSEENWGKTLIDRRKFLSNFDGGGYDVDTDPISESEIGVYNIDFYPSGDFLAGNINLENFQPSKAASEVGNANFQARLTWSFTCNQFYTRVPQTIAIIEEWNIRHMNAAGVYEIVPNNSLECAFYYDGQNHSYASRDFLSEATSDKDNDSHIQTTSGKRSYSMADLYSIFNECGFTDTVTGSPKTKIRQSAAVKACTVTLTITCEYGVEQKSKQVANVTYDYISGETYKSGFTSTDNNTNPDDIPSDIQEGQNSITSGVSGVATSIAPQFINNNNPTITINNNPALNIPGGGDGSGGDDTDINTTINAAWDGIDFIKNWPTLIRDNDFLNYLFSEDIWSIQPFNLILPALALIIIVSIATAIIRFVRGG